MSDLYPTPTRLALLRAVVYGLVFHRNGNDIDHRDRGRVTARMKEMERAGWVEIGLPYRPGFGQPWRLTEAGRAVLDANGGAS